MTILRILEQFKTELVSLHPGSEIEALFWIAAEKLLNTARLHLMMDLEKPLPSNIHAQFNDIIQALKTNKPIQYILQEAPFYGNLFYVNEHVLIPRPETEELVELICKENGTDEKQVLDLGTGSGCIAISLKLIKPLWRLSAIDISNEAIEVAKHNAQLLKADVDLKQGDIFALLSSDNTWDIIVSNPPYIKEEEKKQMHANVLLHEPHEALFVENTDALKYYRTIVQFAQNSLKKGGKLYFEINEQYGKDVAKLLQTNGFKNVSIHQDIPGKDRMVSGVW